MSSLSQRPPLTGRMPSVCMTCGDTYGGKPCLPEHDGKPSHGYCPACFARVMDELQRAPIFSCPRFNDEIPRALPPAGGS